MGTYIKKVLGYGMEMKTEELSEIINLTAFRQIGQLEPGDYKKFLEEKYASVPSDDIAYYLNDLQNGGLVNSDYHAMNLITVADNALQVEGTPDIPSLSWIVVSPLLTHKEWKRNDDPLDFAEAMHKYQDEETFQYDFSMKFFNQGLFPYEGTFVNHATGERLSDNRVVTLKRYLRVTAGKPTPQGDKTLRLLLATLGLSSVEEFQTLIHPAPPESVIDIGEWTGIFKDPSVAHRLRPALLTYWS